MAEEGDKNALFGTLKREERKAGRHPTPTPHTKKEGRDAISSSESRTLNSIQGVTVVVATMKVLQHVH